MARHLPTVRGGHLESAPALRDEIGSCCDASLHQRVHDGRQGLKLARGGKRKGRVTWKESGHEKRRSEIEESPAIGNEKVGRGGQGERLPNLV